MSLIPAGWLLLALGPLPAAGGSQAAVEFVHVTDLHVGGAEAEEAVGGILRRIDAAYPKLDLIALTGDSVNSASRPEEVERYRRAVAGLRAPVHVAPGNHDLDEAGKVPPGLCERSYHSFDAGGVHFAAVDVYGARPEQEAWLEADLAAASRKGSSVIVLSHDALGRDHRAGVHLREAARRSRADVLAVFAGHWHADRVFDDAGFKTLLTPPLAVGGITSALMGYRHVRVSEGGLRWEYIPAGLDRRTSVLAYRSPDGRGVRLIARFLDSFQQAAGAAAIGEGRTVRLEKVSRWAFTIDAPADRLPRRGILRWVDADGGILAESSFSIPDRSAPAPRLAGDWATFHKDGRRTGITRDDPDPDLDIAWAAPTGGTPYSASPVYRDGRVFLAAAAWDSETKPSLSAYDAASGRRLWSTELPAAVLHTPSVTAAAVSAMTVNGEFCLLDPAEGTLRSVQPSSGPAYQVHTPVATATDGAGRHVGGTHAHLFVADAGGRSVVEYSSGTVDDWVPTLTSPASDGDSTFVGSLWRDGLREVSHADGTALRSFPVLENYGSSPVLGRELLYYVGDGRLQARDRATGDAVWTAAGFARVAATPALDEGDGAVYAIDDAADLVRFDAGSGAEVWRSSFAAVTTLGAVPYRRGGRQAIASPAVAGSRVWAADLEGNVCALGKSDGKLMGCFALGAPTASSPAVSGDTLFIAAMDGFLYALTGAAP